MHEIVQRIIRIENQIKEEISEISLDSCSIKIPKIIAISKTFSLDKIMPLVEYGHLHFGENKVQEAKLKWTNLKKDKPNLNLHFVGKIQSNKAKDIVSLFDYVHSLESIKQAEIFSKFEKIFNRKLKYFLQVNIGLEKQKSGIELKNVKNFLEICKVKNNLNIIGLMCLPPNDQSPEKYFKQIQNLKMSLFSSHRDQVSELSMGMSNDYIKAIHFGSSFIRIGSKIFGTRK